MKQIPAAVTTFGALLTIAIIERRDKQLSSQCGAFSSIFCGIIIAGFAFNFQKGGDRNIRLASLLISSLFFISTQINFVVAPRLNPIYSAICNQPKTVVVYLLSLMFLRNKFRITNVIGIGLIIASIILLSTNVESSPKQNGLASALVAALGSVFAGLAMFTFDYLIRSKNVCFYNYVFLTQMYTIGISLAFLLVKKLLWAQNSTLSYAYIFGNWKFYVLAVSYTALSVSMFVQSFVFTLIPRILVNIVTHTSANIIAQWVCNGCLERKILMNYLLCMVGVLVYQYSNIKQYFANKRREAVDAP